MRSEAYRTIRVCIDSCERGILTGTFCNLGHNEESYSFSSLMQLIVGMEQMFDSVNYPQSYTAIRSFVPVSESQLESQAARKQKKGCLATFVIKVLFRQHTSWQGSIAWLDTKSEQTFRSVLELILLMDSALNEGQERLKPVV